MLWDRKSLSIVLILACAGCSPQQFFYYPNRVLYADPDRLAVKNEIVQYPSVNGKKLVGLFFPSEGRTKGTVIHFHGNFGNVSNHFPLALFLIKRGYNVLSFDYQGYGASEGRPSPAHMVEDGIASVHFAQTHTPGPPVFIFGQSIGAAVAIVVAAKEPAVKAAVLEAPFASYTSQAAQVVGHHWPLWFLFPLVPLVNHRESPLRYIAQIAPRPVLLIHGDADTIVSVRMSERLFAAANEPKQLWIVKGAGHLECRRANRQQYEDKVDSFFEKAQR